MLVRNLDREQLLKWAREAPIDSPESLGRALLGRLELFQGRSYQLTRHWSQRSIPFCLTWRYCHESVRAAARCERLRPL